MKQHWLPLLTIAIVVASTFMVGSTLGAVLQSSASAGPSEFAAPLTHQSFADRADAVIDRLQRRVSSLPDDAGAWTALGGAYLGKAREAADARLYGKAEEAFTTALQQDSSAVEAMAGLGQLALARHQFAEALEWGERARTITPAAPAVHGVLGDAYVELGRFDEAFTAFQTMVDLRPDLSSYARASYARELLGNIDGAIEAMALAARAGGIVGEPAAWACVQLGNLLWDYRADAAAAQSEYERALFAYPDYAAAHAGLARVAAGQGDLPGALLRATNAVTYQPTTEHLILLADVLQAAGRPAEAARQRALVRSVDALSTASGADSDLEMAEFDADLAFEPDATFAAAKAAHARRPGAKAAEVLAWAAFRAGAIPEAQAAIAAPLALGVSHPLTLYRAAAIAAAAGQRDEALALVDRALAANPTFSIRYAEEAARLRDALQTGVAQ